MALHTCHNPCIPRCTCPRHSTYSSVYQTDNIISLLNHIVSFSFPILLHTVHSFPPRGAVIAGQISNALYMFGKCICLSRMDQWSIENVLRPCQFNNLVLGIALSDFFENVKKYKSTSGQKLDRKVQFFNFRL